MTRAFNDKKVRQLHNLKVSGLIDRDYLTETEIDSYKKDHIFPIDVAEVENLFLIEGLIKIAAEHLAEDPNEIFGKVKSFVFEEFDKERDLQISSACAKEISYRLSKLGKPKGTTPKDYVKQIQKYVNENIVHIFDKKQKQIDEICKAQNYNELLRIYNRKSLHERVSKKIGLDDGEYPKLILRLLKTDKKETIIKAIREFLPKEEELNAE